MWKHRADTWCYGTKQQQQQQQSVGVEVEAVKRPLIHFF